MASSAKLKKRAGTNARSRSSGWVTLIPTVELSHGISWAAASIGGACLIQEVSVESDVASPGVRFGASRWPMSVPAPPELAISRMSDHPAGARDAFHNGVSAEQPRRPLGLLTPGGSPFSWNGVYQDRSAHGSPRG